MKIFPIPKLYISFYPNPRESSTNDDNGNRDTEGTSMKYEIYFFVFYYNKN